MSPLPLKWRLSLLVTAVLVAMAAAVSTVAYLEVRESLLASLNESLLTVANDMMAEVDDVSDTAALLDAFRATLRGTTLARAARYRVWVDGAAEDLADGGVGGAAAGQTLARLSPAAKPGPETHAFFALGPHGKAVWVRHRTRRGETNVAVYSSDRKAAHELDEFLRVLLFAAGSMVLAGCLLGTLTVAWAIRPIAHTAARLRGLTHRNLGRESFGDIAVPRELRPFVDAVAGLLARLDLAMQHERRFTADASHELRTPLALAKSTLQAIRTRDRTGGEYQQAIDETLDDLRRAERLMSQLLALARMDEGGDLPGAAEVPLDALLAQVVADAAARASQAGARVVLEAAAPTQVRGNEEQLTQLFANLVENALIHGPRSGTVRVALAHEADSCCTVRVHDEGGAIPPDVLPRLFDRFYRADASRSRGTGGAGLGLAIAREVARRHGGDVEIASSPAAGTCATVRLPRA